MKKSFLFSLLMLWVMAAGAAPKADYGQVVPVPDKIVYNAKGGDYVLSATTVIAYPAHDAAMERDAAFLAQYVKDMTRLDLPTVPVKSKSKGGITLTLDRKARLAPEAYVITVDRRGVTVTGATPAGVFYGIQTLRKALPVLSEAQSVELPAARLEAQPRFGYRGLMLDCSRHFFPVKFVKQYIDLLALHGMNRFHWHLSDDQGWRFPVPGYPRLTEVGSKRAQTVMGHNSEVLDGTPYGGYYTDEEIRDIVKYAADRYITIVPEVDMPGHMMAALAAYPELGCTGGPYKTGEYWGVYPDILCAGNEKTYAFVKAVLDHVCDLFPSKYIHIGGDESPRVRWEHCPRCQTMIARQGLKDRDGHAKEALLQGYFAHRVQQYLETKGRHIIGWDELLECDVDTSATIMSWRGAEPGAKGATMGHDIIMSPSNALYFDYYQSKDQSSEPPAIGGFSDVANVYNMEPVPAELTPQAKAHIKGVQANLWTEYISNPNQAEYMILPRMAALAEVQWLQPAEKDFGAFRKRVSSLRHIYDLYGYTYAHHLWPEEFRKGARQY